MKINVKKRTGKSEPFSVEKIHQVVSWAVKDISNVSMSDIEMNAELSLYNNIKTSEIHDILIQSANDLISQDSPNYQYVAARLLSYKLRKDIWGGHTPPSLLEHINLCKKKKLYDREILGKYTKEEIEELGHHINHDRDEKYTFAGLQQLTDKYLLKDRNTNVIYETPQFLYMVLSMFIFHDYKEDRLDFIKNAYDLFSTFKINLPTPIMAGLRTNTKQFASCVLVDVDDSLESLTSSNTAVAKYTARRAGIGLNFGRVRAINSPIRGGEVISTGVIPYLKMFESTVKATSQNGIRGGSATVNFPIWHYEIEDVLVLKNNAGTDDNRVRKLDYVIQISELFYKRFLEDGDITLFSPNEARDLYDAFGHENFDELYLSYEKKHVQFKKKVKARKLFEILARERLETGRIYIMNIDHCNSATSWDGDVKMANLCVEINHITQPLDNDKELEPEVGICILSAINLLEISSDEELASVCDTIVRTLNSIIDYQDYPIEAGKTFATKRRSLGVGVTNLAGFLAKNKLSYHDQEALELVDEYMEKIQYYLLKSSCDMAKEYGPCEKYGDTKYSKGLLPIDWMNQNAKTLVERKPSMDWEGLRAEIKEHGLFNSTLTAIMPCESSSVVQNSTNGIEPIRNLLSYKKSKMGTLKQIVPLFHKNRKYYDLAFDFLDNSSIIKMSATIQKWVDMSMSTNHYYNYKYYENGIIPLSVIVKDLITSYKYGIKTIYYANTPDGDVESLSSCDSGACAI